MDLPPVDPVLHCAHCPATLTPDTLLDHVEAEHPDLAAALQRWPDGGLVVLPFIDDHTGEDTP